MLRVDVSQPGTFHRCDGGGLMGKWHSKHILVVEDDTGLADMLQAYLEMQGYQVTTALSGYAGMHAAVDLHPDLVLLDIRLPDIDGFEVYRRLSERHTTRFIPAIFLTELRERDSRLAGLELGAYDYITKPFDIVELRLRVRNVLKRAELGIAINAVTGLPEGEATDEALMNCIEKRGGNCCALVATLHGLESFRELYGFVASDEVLRFAGLTLATAVEELEGPEGYCGHLEPNRFLVVVSYSVLNILQARIMGRLEGALDYFYPVDNRGPNARTHDRLYLEMRELTNLRHYNAPGDVRAWVLRQQ